MVSIFAAFVCFTTLLKEYFGVSYSRLTKQDIYRQDLRLWGGHFSLFLTFYRREEYNIARHLFIRQC